MKKFVKIVLVSAFVLAAVISCKSNKTEATTETVEQPAGKAVEFRSDVVKTTLGGKEISCWNYVKFYDDNTFVWGIYPEVDEGADCSVDIEKGVFTGDVSKAGNLTLTTTSIFNRDTGSWQIINMIDNPTKNEVPVSGSAPNLTLEMNGKSYSKK